MHCWYYYYSFVVLVVVVAVVLVLVLVAAAAAVVVAMLPALIPQRIERCPAWVTLQQQVVALDQHDLVRSGMGSR